jgi:flagellar basal-body rod protein FlgC
MATGNLFHAFDVSAAGLSMQRARLNVLAANLANAQTTRTAEGGPYLRRIVTAQAAGALPGGESLFELLLRTSRATALKVRRSDPGHFGEPELLRFAALAEGPPAITVDVDRDAPTRLEYEPGHPDANEEGFVEYPNVEIIREMVDLIGASRAYEANVTVLSATKAMLRKALEI